METSADFFITQNNTVSESSVSDTKTEIPETIQCRQGVSVLYLFLEDGSSFGLRLVSCLYNNNA